MNNLQLTVLLNAIDKMSAPMKNASKSVNALSEQLKQSKSALRDLEKVQNQMGAFSRTTENIKKSTEAIDKHAKKLDNLRNKISKMKDDRVNLKGKIKDAELYHAKLISQGDVVSALGVRARISDLTKQYERLKGDIGSTRKKITQVDSTWKASRREKAQQLLQLRDLKRRLKEIGVDTKNFAQHEGTLAEKIKMANTAIEKQKSALEKANRAKARNDKYQAQVSWLKDKSDRMANFGQKTMISGVATAGLLAKPTQEFAAAERAATNLKVAMMDKDGKVSDSYEKINQLATELGNRLPGTTADFKDLMTMLIRQGMGVDTILGGTGEAAAYLSVQLEMPPKQAAEFAAKMQDATRTTEKDMMGLMDVIQKGFYAGVDPTNMLGAFKNLGSAMDMIKIKGLNGAKVLAPFVAMFDQAGMDGSASGNAMRKVLQRGMDTGSIGKELKKLKKSGMISKGFDIDFTDGKGEFGGFDHMFKELEKLKKLDTESRNKIIKQVFGDDAEVNMVLSTIIEKGKAGYEEFAVKMEKQAELRKRVDEQLRTLSNVWEAATGTFTNLLVEIGSTYAPQLKALIDEFGALAEKAMNWVKANPELVGSFAKFIAIGGATMIVVGGLSTLLSYTLYPVARLGLGFAKLTGINTLLAKSFNNTTKTAITSNKHLFSFRGWKSVFQFASSSVGEFIGKMGKLSTWIKGLKTLLRVAFSPVKMLFMGLGSVISFLFSPIGLLGAAFVTAGVLIYKNWEKVKAFFGGFWEGLKSGLAPVIEKFKPLGNLFGVVVGWIEKAVKWFTDLLSPVQTTQKDLDAAASAGKKFGEWLAAGIDLVTKPLQWVMDSIKWIVDNMPSVEGIGKAIDKGNQISQQAQQIKREGITEAFGNGFWGRTMQILSDPDLQHWKGGFVKGWATGGYTGNGGKYEPAGIVHGGEYVMTKEATSRLGINTLNALNYGKQALIAGGLGISVVTAAPVQVDTRAPISTRPVMTQSNQPMSVNITIHAAQGMDERAIAQQVAKEIQRIENQRQARARSSMWDRA